MDLIKNFDYFHYSIFIISSIGLSKSYPFIKSILCKSSKFKSLDTRKQYYIIKNLIKSACLSLLFSFMVTTLIPNIINDVWSDSCNRAMGIFYVSNDLAGLLAVPQLPFSTKLHHYTTVFLYTIICAMSTENGKNISQLIVVYTIFSCIPYLVNSYLALRFFYNITDNSSENLTRIQKSENYIINLNRISAFYIYIVSCSFNWIYHLFFLINIINNHEVNIGYIIYYLLLIPIINDDIILMKWLRKSKLDI